MTEVEKAYKEGRDSAIKELMQCLDDEALCSWVLSKDNEGNMKKLIHDIISWNVNVALDPLVSRDAQKLIDRGRDQILSDLKLPSGVTPYSSKLKFYQESDCCDPDNHGQVISLWTEDGGGGDYFCMSTERWAFDSIDDLIKVLKQLDRIKVTPNEL